MGIVITEGELDADKFSVVVFASMSYKYIDTAQMKFRVKRIHNLHENTFIYLLGGKCDKACYDCISAGKNFDPIEYFTGVTAEVRQERSESNTQSVGVVSDPEQPF